MNSKTFYLSLVLLSILLLSGYTSIGSVRGAIWVVPNQHHMIVESIGDPETVDPAWVYDTASEELIFNAYEPLIQFDFESVENFVPCLATEWTVSPDGLTYTFKIREGVQFHDGSIMTTEDVEYSFERLMVQDRSGGPAWMIYEPLLDRQHADMSWPEDSSCPINQVVQSSSTHVWFNLAIPYPPFMQILSQTWSSIIHKDFAIAYGDWPGTWTNWKEFHRPVRSPLDVAGNVMCGTGPYKLDYLTKGVEWSIVKFDDYWRGWPAPHSSNYLERATVKVVYEWGTRLADFRAGTADSVCVPRAYIAQVEGWPGIRGIKDLPGLSVDAMFFNFDITMPSPYVGSGALDGNGIPANFFSDIHVRNAFAYAFDHTQYVSNIFLNEAETPPTPHIRGIAYSSAVWDGVDNDYYGWLDPVPIRDIDLAKVTSELKLAFNGEVWTKGFKMTIAYNAGNVPRQTAALMFKENLESLNSDPTFGGCTINTVAVTWSTYLGEIWNYPTYKSNLPLYAMGWSADYPDPHDFVMPFQHSQGYFAYPSSYYNPTVDEWIEAGIAELNPVEREKIYWDIAMSYYNDVPGICLAQPLGRHWERHWVQGWYYNPVHPGYYFYHLWKGIDSDLNGDDIVDDLDGIILQSHMGPNYDRVADIWPVLQYRGDLDPASWLPKDELGNPLPSIGEVDVWDYMLFNSQWGDTKVPPTTPVTIDIKPDSYPNSICLDDEGQLPVAIFGSATFDVETINPHTLELGGVDISARGSAKAPKIAFSIEDVNADGYPDMMTFFSVSDLVTVEALTPTTTELELTGTLSDGTHIAGTDDVNVVPST